MSRADHAEYRMKLLKQKIAEAKLELDRLKSRTDLPPIVVTQLPIVVEQFEIFEKLVHSGNLPPAPRAKLAWTTLLIEDWDPQWPATARVFEAMDLYRRI